MNLKGLAFEISDVALQIHKIFHPSFSLHDTFMEKEPSTKFYSVSHELMKLQSFK